MGRRFAMALTVAMLVAVVPGIVSAQEVDDEVERHPTRYLDSESGWSEQRFYVAAFAGRLTGGTNLGTADNLFFAAQFEQGTDATQSVRLGYVFAPRFDVELEYGRASPGLNAILSDLRGQGRTVLEYADLDLDWQVASVSYSVVERTRRIAPYLTLGVGRMGVSSSTEPDVDTSELVLAYGGGLRVRVVDPFAFRADVRGLRSGLGGKDESGATPGLLQGQFNGTNLVWTAGVEFRF